MRSACCFFSLMVISRTFSNAMGVKRVGISSVASMKPLVWRFFMVRKIWALSFLSNWAVSVPLIGACLEMHK